MTLQWRGTATFTYEGRTRLSRLCNFGEGSLLLIMLNPSQAGADEDDPTIRRGKDFTVRLGKKRLVVCNLFSHIATNPDELWKAVPVPVTDANKVLRKEFSCITKLDTVVCAWGARPKPVRTFTQWEKRVAFIHELSNEFGVVLYCLGKTSKGDPKHPLYLSKESQLELFYSPFSADYK